MADVRISSTLPAIATPAPARTTDAVRAAQRAFFTAALVDAGGPAPVRSAAASSAPVLSSSASAAPRPAAAAFADDQPAPSRPLRPGSLLDIRI